MLHDLYPLEEAAEKEEIIATRPGSWYYHDKAGTKQEGAVPSEQLALCALQSLPVASLWLVRGCQQRGSWARCSSGPFFIFFFLFFLSPFGLLTAARSHFRTRVR